METNEPNNELTPGRLQKAFDNFTPPMPEGSWERLENRRKKRKRGLFWWLPVLLLCVLGGGWYGLTQIQPEGTAPAGGDRVHEIADERPREKIAKLAPAEPAPGTETMQKTRTPSHTETGDVSSTAQPPVSKNEITKTTEGTGRKRREGATWQTERRPGLSRVLLAEKSESMKKSREERPNRNQKAKSAQPMVTELGMVADANTNRSGDGPSGKRHYPASKSMGNPNVPLKSTEAVNSNTRNEEKTNERLGMEETKPAPDAGENPIPVTGRMDSTQTLVAASDDSTSKKIEPMVSKTDPVVTLTAPDTGETKIKNPTSRFELGTVVQVVNQQIVLPAWKVSETDATTTRPGQVLPAWGFYVQGKWAAIQKSHFHLLPVLELGVIRQEITYRQVPGPAAPMVLIKTNNGIEGRPMDAEKETSSTRWFATVGAGLEAGYQLTRSVTIRGGAVYFQSVNFGSGAASLTRPALFAGTMVRLRPRLWLQARVQYFKLKGAVLPGNGKAEGLSENMGYGLGLQWAL